MTSWQLAVIAGVKLVLLYLRVVDEILGDKVIEWFLDMIINNSNNIIVTFTMLSCRLLHVRISSADHDPQWRRPWLKRFLGPGS